MARHKRGAKSQAIRDYLATHPNAAPKEVVAAVKEQGIKVSSQMVSTLKAKGSGNGPRKAKATRNGQALSIETLVRAKQLAQEFGGLESARSALAALASLQ